MPQESATPQESDAASHEVIKTQANAASGGQGIPDAFKIIGDEIASEMRFLFFPPGDYNVTVVAKYRTTSEESTTLLIERLLRSPRYM